MPALDAMRPEARPAVLEVVLRMLWADGRMAEHEVAALRAVSVALGLSGLSAADQQNPPSLDDLRLDDLDPREQRLVYVAAAWMALTDGVVLPSEDAMLEWLRLRLGIATDVAEALRASARALRTGALSAAPGWREFDQLMVDAVQSHVAELREAS